MIHLDFDKQGGMVPVIAQDYRTNEVLMLAYMNTSPVLASWAIAGINLSVIEKIIVI